MKNILYLLVPLLFLACKGEDTITSSLDYTDDFSITDSADDPVQHARFEIYKKYGVPVFFNDTIVAHNTGTDGQGREMKRYETVNLNWTFFGYSQGITYTYDYLRSPEEQLRALRFVDSYLSTLSKPMRPFSVMIADTLTVTSANKIERPIYYVGFRTLVLSQIKDITTSDSVKMQISKIVNSMVSDRVKADRTLCGRFADVSSQKGWYDMEWKKLNETSPCPTTLRLLKKSYMFSPNALFDQPPYTTFDHEDIVTLLLKDFGTGAAVNTEEEAIALRDSIITEIGTFGFIRGWNQSGSFGPRDDEEDREYFVKAILYLGNGGFRQRYGHLPIVMQKYEILHDFIEKTLGVNLNYNTLSE